MKVVTSIDLFPISRLFAGLLTHRRTYVRKYEKPMARLPRESDDPFPEERSHDYLSDLAEFIANVSGSLPSLYCWDLTNNQ